MAPKGRKRARSSENPEAGDSSSTTTLTTNSQVEGRVPDADVNDSSSTLPTRRSQRKKNIMNGEPIDPPKEKSMTLGQHLFQERMKATQLIEENHDNPINNYEVFVNYDKNEVIKDLNLEEMDGFSHQFYYTPNYQVAVLFIPLSTGPNPKSFSHICNNSSLQWNLQSMHIARSTHFFNLPDVVLVFIQGQYIEGMSLTSSPSLYKCLGLVGVKSVSSGGDPHEYIRVTLVFDYVISRKELLEQFGENVMKCKKNKYGASLCN